MSLSLRSLVTSLAAAALLTVAGPVFATQGYFTLGTGAVDDGQGGAGVAQPKDAASGAVNPAGIVRIGNQYEIGAALFQPNRKYNVVGAVDSQGALAPGSVSSNDKDFGIPNLGYSHRLTVNTALGLNIYANGGLDTDYPGSANGGFGTFGGGPAGVNLEQLFFVPSYSVAVNNKLSFGASIVGAYQLFSASGLSQFGGYVSGGPTNAKSLTNNGTDSSFSVGAKIGVLDIVSPTLSLGAVYQSKTSGSKFDKYSDLFAGGGSFDVPSSALVGLSWKTTQKTTLLFDIQQIWYSDVHAVSNPLSNLNPANSSTSLGGSDGPGFGWRNTTFYKLGYSEDISKRFTIREGLAYGVQPIRPSQVYFNILAPGTTEWHYSLGATAHVTPKSDLSLALVYAPSTTVTGPNPNAPGQTIGLSLGEFQTELGYAVRY